MPFSRPALPQGGYGYLDGMPKLALKPDDFDQAQASVFVRGDRNVVATLFKPASLTSGLNENLFCTGPVITREQWGHCWADITWKGLTGPHDLQFSHTITTRETQWPQEQDGITYFVPGSMIGKPGDINLATGKYWRVRLVDQLAGVSVRGVVKTSINTPPPPPSTGAVAQVGVAGTIGGKNVTPLARPLNFSGLRNPIYNWPRGWVLKNYDMETHPLGDGQALYFWTANYDWVSEYGP